MKATTATSILALTWACGAFALTLASAAAQLKETAKPSTEVGEIVVTAQKREQKIQSVDMSIQAVSGDALTNKGVNSLGDLKACSGFPGRGHWLPRRPDIAIRGVGYHDASLAANPTVTVYNDQAPLPFSIEALGSTLEGICPG